MTLVQFEDVQQGYLEKWETLDINPAKIPLINKSVDKIIAGKSIYQALEIKTGVPWYFIGLVHLRESGCRFDRHLHNGDPLTARTVHVPKNRPTNKRGPFTFEESAIDALNFMGYTLITDWGIARIGYCLEKYNGFGYYYRDIGSPYLWAGSNHYTIGKYVRDGVFNPNVTDTQLGAMCVLKVLLEKENIDLSPTEDIVHDFTTPMSPSADVERPSSSEMRATSRKFMVSDIGKWFNGGTGFSMAGLYAIFPQLMKDNAIFVIIILCLVGVIGFMYLQKLQKDDVEDGRAINSGDNR